MGWEPGLCPRPWRPRPWCWWAVTCLMFRGGVLLQRPLQGGGQSSSVWEKAEKVQCRSFQPSAGLGRDQGLREGTPPLMGGCLLASPREPHLAPCSAGALGVCPWTPDSIAPLLVFSPAPRPPLPAVGVVCGRPFVGDQRVALSSASHHLHGGQASWTPRCPLAWVDPSVGHEAPSSPGSQQRAQERQSLAPRGMERDTQSGWVWGPQPGCIALAAVLLRSLDPRPCPRPRNLTVGAPVPRLALPGRNPVPCSARDRTHNLMVSSCIHFRCATTGTPG